MFNLTKCKSVVIHHSQLNIPTCLCIWISAYKKMSDWYQYRICNWVMLVCRAYELIYILNLLRWIKINSFWCDMAFIIFIWCDKYDILINAGCIHHWYSCTFKEEKYSLLFSDTGSGANMEIKNANSNTSRFSGQQKLYIINHIFKPHSLMKLEFDKIFSQMYLSRHHLVSVVIEEYRTSIPNKDWLAR